MSVATAMARMSPFLAPCVVHQLLVNGLEVKIEQTCTTAVPSATLSAHVPTGYAAFSTFAPSTMLPLVRRMEQPTLKCE